MIEFVPLARVLVLKVATPELLSVPVPSEVVPFMKSTVPVGVPVPGETAATVAVNVTEVPEVLGLGVEVRVVVVLDWLTTKSPEFWVRRLVLSPAKLATMPPVSVPAVSVCVTFARVATPLLSVMAVPTKEPSRVKLRTLPTRPVPVADLRVAVIVAGPPKTAEPEMSAMVVPVCLPTRLWGM